MRFREVRQKKLRPLMEANIVNVDDISKWVNKIISDLQSDQAKQWFTEKVTRFVRRTDRFHFPMNDRNRPANLPDWAEQAQTQNPDIELHIFVPPDDLQVHLEHVVDWFNSQPPTSEIWHRLDRLTVEKAVKLSERWVQEMQRRHRDNDANEGAKTVLEVGGMRWITSNVLDTVKRDGSLLRNCLASDIHSQGIVSGDKTVYILRDANNKPHVALMTQEKISKSGVIEIKGKSNQPPIGRYVSASKEILNQLKLPPVSDTARNDIARMGLFYDTAKVRYGSKVELSEVIISDLLGGYSVSQMPSSSGIEYYIAKGHEVAAVLVVDGNHRVRLQQFMQGDVETVGELVKRFLNSYFDGNPPLPAYTTGHLYSKKSTFDPLNLSLDHRTMKYGHHKEDAVEVYQSPSFRVVAWGPESNRVDYRFLDRNNLDRVFLAMQDDQLDHLVVFGERSSSDAPLKPNKDEQNIKDVAPMVVEFLNSAFSKAPPPRNDYYTRNNDWMRSNGIYYGKGRYGSFTECSSLVHKFRDGMVVRKWSGGGKATKYDEPPTYYTFVKGKKHHYELYVTGSVIQNNDFSYSGRIDTPQFGSALSDAQWEDYEKRLIELLNSAPELKNYSLDEATYSFGELDIVRANGKWGHPRDVASEIFKSGTDAASVYESGGGKNRLMILRSGTPVMSLVLTDFDGERFSIGTKFEVQNGQLGKTSGPFMAKLFTKFRVPGMDIPKSSQWSYGRESLSFTLLHLGLIYVRDRWGMLQNGKTVYQGDGYRVVNLRNRVFFVNDDGSIAGEAVKTGRLADAFWLDNLHACDHWSSQRELLLRVADLARNTNFTPMLPNSRSDRESFWSVAGQYGFTVQDGQLIDVEEVAPPKKIIEFKDGWVWRRQPRTTYWLRYTKDVTAPYENRYELTDPTGDQRMYASFDQDGYLEKVFYGYTATDRHGRVSTGQIGTEVDRVQMGDLVPRLAELIKKQKLKLAPTVAHALGLYVSKDGGVSMMGDDPLLKQFMEGKITFKDGYEFVKRYNHINEWTLVRPKHPEDNFDHYRNLLTIVLDEDGVDSIKVEHKEAKRNFHKYRRYLAVLVRVFAKVAGD